MEEGIKQENNRVYKVIIIVLAIAIVAVGAILLVRTFAPAQEPAIEGLPPGVTMEQGADGSMIFKDGGGEDGEYEVHTFSSDGSEGEDSSGGDGSSSE